jgi:mevalonate kinase
MTKPPSMDRIFPSKILLFGEYTVLLGSPALAFPYAGYSGRWAQASDPDPRLLEWADYLSQIPDLPARVAAFKDDVSQGLIFESQIKGGYGLGSSGALTAAFFHRFGNEFHTLPTETQRQWMARAESAFHGSSSGIDPLVSYLNAPVLYSADQGARPVSIPNPPIDVYLLDSGQARETQKLVSEFRQRMDEQSDFAGHMAQLAEWQGNAIRALVDDHAAAFWQALRQISASQAEHLHWLIPDAIKPLFAQEPAKTGYTVKLCGAGGGGFFLVLAEKGTEPAISGLEKLPL